MRGINRLIWKNTMHRWHCLFLLKYLEFIEALQCCVSFCCTRKWISRMYAHILSLLDLPTIPCPASSHPSRSSQSTKLSSLCYTAASHLLSILHTVVYREGSGTPPVLLPGKSHGWRSLVGWSPSWGREELDTTEQLHFHFSLSCIGEGNGSPLQCSCLEKPRDGGAWWAAVSGVAQSQTRLKWLSSSSRTPKTIGIY